MFFKSGILISLLWASVVFSKELPVTIATGLPKPPFVLNENNGLQIELIRSAFETANIDVKFRNIPLNRNVAALQRYDVSGIALMPKNLSVEGIHLSKPYITYQNVAVSLTHNQFKIDNVKDLSGKSVVAFQNAHKFLGEAFHEQTKYSLEYREVANQQKQIELLESGAAEVIIMDLNILRYYLQSKANLVDRILIHSIFPENHYKAAFNSKELADAFDQGVNKLKATGSYDRILEKYIGSRAYF